jgi:hypothetical protein
VEEKRWILVLRCSVLVILIGAIEKAIQSLELAQWRALLIFA